MKNEKLFSIYTLGCKLNYSESSHISRQLTESGFCLASKGELPGYIIVNSCAVTGTAEKKARNLISRLHRENPDSKIIVVGCFSALQPEQIKGWEGVHAVFGNRDKLSLVSFMQKDDVREIPLFFSTFSSNDRTRSFLKIQDGCDYYCTYCTVAAARGESRSDSIEHVLVQIEKIHQLGIKEIILTGVNIGDFGKGSASTFFDLLKAIERQNLIERIRISSIEPNLLNNDIINLVASSGIIMPHFHIPLQSGSNKILSLMKRRYNRELFADRVSKIKQFMPDACIAIDVITGFPGETEYDFNDTFDFLNELPLSYLHVFTYSKRPDTIAATMPEQVRENVKKERTEKLLVLSDEKKRSFYRQNIGHIRPVLFESDVKNGFIYGFTDNYVRVKFPYQKELVNTISEVKLTGLDEENEVMYADIFRA